MDHILEDGKWCDGNPVSLFLSIWPQIPPSTLIWPAPRPLAEDKHCGARMEYRAARWNKSYKLLSVFCFPTELKLWTRTNAARMFAS